MLTDRFLIILQMLPLEHFLYYASKHQLFSKNDRILLAVSGGRDSVLMVQFFKQLELNFGIAHCNFMLRNTESDAEEAFVQDLAEKLQVPYHSERFRTEEYARKQAISIQMAARDLRYQWLEKMRSSEGYDHIAVAHHSSDSVETILLNLIRGTGIAGLHGIQPKRGRIIRPLLFLTREEIDSLVLSNGFSYCEDSSNSSTKYARNKLRHDVVPVLKSLNPNLEQTFEANSRRFLELEELLNQKVEQLRDQLFEDKYTGIQIKQADVLSLHPNHTLFYELLKPYDFTEAVVSEILEKSSWRTGTRYESKTHQLLVDRDHFVISAKVQGTAELVTIEEQMTEATWKAYQFKIQQVDNAFPYDFSDESKAYIAAEKLIFPLIIRSWQVSDRFQPFGMAGHEKKLSDFFIQQKVSLLQKNQIPIVVNGNGEIIWIAGMRLDERYKLESTTRKVYILAVFNNYGK